MSSADPRRPDKVVAFHMPPVPEDEASDWNSNIAMYTAMAGIFLRNQFLALPWVSAYFGLASFLNSRKSVKSSDFFGGSGAMIAVVSLMTYYINIYATHKRALAMYGTENVDEGIGAV
ncbi:uncharacterized protein BX664DRAFT_321212 [Halteromyces radiatus]|uniref:uncharacterized protein n=1 Tax=Halteromyces radiatus TaxID=101107 RepID=UPI00221E9AB5|nr:uncharacterized protein BX664DRAFT_321212 [Halteromyces radiatus]KAI8099422.1 hypothetical protein BX664DRAFT_321212 [Halteromyces radiatus]